MRDTLLAMLTYARPMGSRAERKFRNRFLAPLGATVDRWHNLHVRVGTDPAILWSSHTDTVHHRHGRQRVEVDGLDYARLPAWSQSSCLGGDDTVGVYLMAEMIRAGVPGDYVFHHGEERGCQGSSDLSWFRQNWIREHAAAIALDRAGTTDIVTHQTGTRCASDAFTASLATCLTTANPRVVLTGAHGVYTDTAEYMRDIPECTNLSVGYRGQHTRTEHIDLLYVEELRQALITADFSQLVIERNPHAREPLAIDDWRYWPDTDPAVLTVDELSEAEREFLEDRPTLYFPRVPGDDDPRTHNPYDDDDESDPEAAQHLMTRLYDEWQADKRREAARLPRPHLRALSSPTRH